MSRVAPRSTLCCRPLVVEQGALSGYPGAAAHCFVRACFSHEHWELSTSESDGSVVGQRFGTLAADGLPFSPRGGRSLGGRVSRVAPRSILRCRSLVVEQGVLLPGVCLKAMAGRAMLLLGHMELPTSQAVERLGDGCHWAIARMGRHADRTAKGLSYALDISNMVFCHGWNGLTQPITVHLLFRYLQ